MIWFWTCSTVWCTSHPNSLDVPQAILVVPAIRRKAFWLAQAHRLLGYFNQWVGWNRISWYWHLQITKMFFVYSWTRWKPLTTLTYRGLKGAEFCTCFRPSSCLKNCIHVYICLFMKGYSCQVFFKSNYGHSILGKPFPALLESYISTRRW